jgi:hypothetical protein
MLLSVCEAWLTLRQLTCEGPLFTSRLLYSHGFALILFSLWAFITPFGSLFGSLPEEGIHSRVEAQGCHLAPSSKMVGRKLWHRPCSGSEVVESQARYVECQVGDVEVKQRLARA